MTSRFVAGSAWRCAIVFGGAFILACSSALAQSKSANSIVALKEKDAGKSYELTITSEEPFLRSDLPVLKIGDQEITISRAAAPDQHNAQTFILTPEQFRKAKNGDRVAFQWGSGEGRTQLDMGTLDKSKLTK